MLAGPLLDLSDQDGPGGAGAATAPRSWRPFVIYLLLTHAFRGENQQPCVAWRLGDPRAGVAREVRDLRVAQDRIPPQPPGSVSISLATDDSDLHVDQPPAELRRHRCDNMHHIDTEPQNGD
jgi:hypothetical protein